MTDKVIKSEYSDAMGTWVIYEDLSMELLEASEAWIKRRKEMEEEVSVIEPTPEDYMMDLDYRLSLIELGLQEV